MPDPSPLSTGQALGRWIVYTLLFMLAGGLAAGISALLYEWIVQDTYSAELYAVIFGVSGYIAYRLARRVRQIPPRG